MTGEAAAMADDSRLHLRTKVMAARHALAAMHAATGIPSDSDTLAHLDWFGLRTDRRHAPDHLMTENRRVLLNAPLVIKHGEIGVTQAATFDCDLDLLNAERPEIDGFEDHGQFRGPCDPALCGV